MGNIETTRPKFFPGYEDGFLPFTPAAGAITGLIEEEIIAKILDVAKSPAAAVKYGSFTFNGGLGNEGKVYHHNQITGITVNGIGLGNIGHRRGVELQKQLQPQVEAEGKSLIPSFSPGKGENPLEVLPAMAYAFVEAGATKIEPNYSCPNKRVEGGGSYEPVLGYDLDSMFEVDERIVEAVGPDTTILRKLPPLVGEKKILLPPMVDGFNAVNERARGRGQVVLGLFNTIPAQSVLDELGDPALSVGETKDNLGGASGRAFAGMAIDGLMRFKQRLDPTIGTISSVGVYSAQEIYRRVDVEGADLAEGVTVLWQNELNYGKSFGQTITEMAEQYHQIHEET